MGHYHSRRYVNLIGVTMKRKIIKPTEEQLLEFKIKISLSVISMFEDVLRIQAITTEMASLSKGLAKAEQTKFNYLRDRVDNEVFKPMVTKITNLKNEIILGSVIHTNEEE